MLLEYSAALRLDAWCGHVWKKSWADLQVLKLSIDGTGLRKRLVGLCIRNKSWGCKWGHTKSIGQRDRAEDSFQWSGHWNTRVGVSSEEEFGPRLWIPTSWVRTQKF